MGIRTELHFDKDECDHCGCLLSEHIAGKRPIYRLHEHDDTLYNTLVYRIVCDHCGHVNEVFYFGQSITDFFDEHETKSEFGCVPAL